jgi:hypothetical protein
MIFLVSFDFPKYLFNFFSLFWLFINSLSKVNNHQIFHLILLQISAPAHKMSGWFKTK